MQNTHLRQCNRLASPPDQRSPAGQATPGKRARKPHLGEFETLYFRRLPRKGHLADRFGSLGVARQPRGHPAIGHFIRAVHAILPARRLGHGQPPVAPLVRRIVAEMPFSGHGVCRSTTARSFHTGAFKAPARSGARRDVRKQMTAVAVAPALRPPARAMTR